MSDEPLILTGDERRLLARVLRERIEGERFPYAPHLDPLRALLAKLDPPAPQPEPLPPLQGPAPRRATGAIGNGDETRTGLRF